jgi:hypothetical protein
VLSRQVNGTLWVVGACHSPRCRCRRRTVGQTNVPMCSSSMSSERFSRSRMPTKCVSRRVSIRSTHYGHCRSCYSLQCWWRRNPRPCASSTRAMVRPHSTMRCSCLKTVERVRSKACVHADFTARPVRAGVGSLSSAMVLSSSLNARMATASPANTPEGPHFTL